MVHMNDSCSFSVESSVRLRRRRRRRKGRSPNRLYHQESVKLSSWYRNFLRPGMMRDLTHELSTSDRFGEFRSLFRMPLSKVEESTDIFISRGYIEVPRSLKFSESSASVQSCWLCQRSIVWEMATRFANVGRCVTSAFLRYVCSSLISLLRWST